MRIAKETERDPAGEELRLDEAVARDEAVLGGNLIRDLRVSVVERAPATDAPLGPPIIEVEKDVWLARRLEQHFPRFLAVLLVLGAPQPLNAVEAQTYIGLDRVCRQCIEQLAGVAAALHYGDARGNLLLFVSGKELGDPERRFRRSFL